MLIAHVFCLFVCSGCPTQCGYGWRQCIGIRTLFCDSWTLLLLTSPSSRHLAVPVANWDTFVHSPSHLHHCNSVHAQVKELRCQVISLDSTLQHCPYSLSPPPPPPPIFLSQITLESLFGCFLLHVLTKGKKTPLNKLLIMTGSNKKKETRMKV